MAGGSIDIDGNILNDITMVLVGCTGSGKSATGNSILGRNEFHSKFNFGRVTTVCKQEATKLDGRIVKVIDTPGLFDSITPAEVVEKEIVRCIQMAKDGIHAVLLVVSLKVRFSDEQAAVFETLKHLFGEKIVDHMIVTFTGGDLLIKRKTTLDEHLARSCPKGLKDLLDKCGNRKVVFDNKTGDATKKAEQRDQLLTLINSIILKNGGNRYTHEIFSQISKKQDAEKDAEISKQEKQKKEQQLQQRITEMVQEKLKERDEDAINKLKQDLERVQREANESIREQQEADRNEILTLRRQLERAQLEAANRRRRCTVL